MKPDVNDMAQELYEKYVLWKERMGQAGIPYTLTCVKRTIAEQEALYAQGRTPIYRVNALRKECGMYPLTEKENGYKVTWTRNSKHFGLQDGKSRAFDFAILKADKKTINWDTKWDQDHDGIPEYLEAAKFAVEVGLDSGAFWKNQDWPHIQLKGE